MKWRENSDMNKKKKIIILTSAIVLFSIIAIIGTVIFLRTSPKEETVQDTFLPEEEFLQDSAEYIEEYNEEEIPEEELVPPEDEKPVESEKILKSNVTNEMPYYVKVNCGAQTVTIYKKDAEGNYTVPAKIMVCSTGTETPASGIFKIPKTYSKPIKAKWHPLQGGVWGQYITRITGNILFHSVPYERKDPATLEWWEYDKLGTKASLGCIRLRVIDAKWIYDNCKSGTQVEFYSSSDTSGKPSAQKISEADPSVRVWDPTDPNSENPWRTYKEETKEEKPNTNQIENTVENQVGGNKQNNTIVNEIGGNEKEDNKTNNVEEKPGKDEPDKDSNNDIKDDNTISNAIEGTNDKESSENKQNITKVIE